MKQTRGGARKGAGRKAIFKDKTKGVKFTCPVSKEQELKTHVNVKIQQWVKEGV